MTLTGLAVLVGAAYLAGSIPFGLLAGLLKGVDIRKAGSQNIGASNAGRILGKPWFFLILFLDAIKGLIPVLAAGFWLRHAADPVLQASQTWQQIAWLSVALAAILGHLFPIYLGFKGGRGVATALGVVLAIWPYYTIPGLLAFVLWWIIKWASGYISVASIAACLAFPFLVIGVARMAGWPLGSLLPLVVFAVAIAVIVVLRHWPNIQRLLAGSELAPDRPDQDKA
jgi:acyl phosphate:glycerol-3-phosphate acyltransferase